MFLSINKAKVAELLESSNKGYTVENVPIVVENCTPVYPVASEISGTVYTAPVLITAEIRDRLMSVRRQIEESGVPLKGVEELRKEIDAMRGRS
jgi:hypothetical protein